MFCPECGTKLTEDDAFCPQCGARNSSIGAPAAQSPAAPATPYDAPTEPVNAAPEMAETAENAPQSAGYGSQTPTDPVAGYGGQTPTDPVAGYGSQTPTDPVAGYGSQAPADPVAGYGSQTPADPLAAYGINIPFTPIPGVDGAGAPPAGPGPRDLGARKGRKGKPLAIAAAALAAVLALGLLIYGLVCLFSPALRLKHAAQRSEKQLAAYLSQMPNMKKVVNTVKTLSNRRAFTATLDGSVSMGDARFNVDSRVDYSYSKRAMRVDLDPDMAVAVICGDYDYPEAMKSYAGQKASLFVNSKQIQVRDDIATDGGVYSFPLKNLGKRWNDSDLADMADFELPDSLSIDPFHPGKSMDKLMKDTFGKDWTVFKRSVRVKTVKAKDSLFDDARKGTTYSLSWGDDALEDLADAAQDLIDDHYVQKKVFDDYNYEWYYESYYEYDKEFTPFTRVICTMIVEFQESVEDLDELKIQFFVQKGCLVGMAVYAEEDRTETTEMLLLNGSKNPWEEITVSRNYERTNSDRSKYTYDHTTTVKLDVSKDNLNVTGKTKYESNDDGYVSKGSYEFMDLTYRDKNGKITGTLGDWKLEDYVDLSVCPDGRSVKVGVRYVGTASVREKYWDDYWEEWDDRRVNKDLVVDLTLTLGPQSGAIKPLDRKPVDLLSLDEDELKDFGDDVSDNVNSFRKKFK